MATRTRLDTANNIEGTRVQLPSLTPTWKQDGPLFAVLASNLKAIIHEGADVNSKTRLLLLCLTIAIAYENEEVACFLLEEFTAYSRYGVDVTWDGLFYSAINNAFLKAARLLLKGRYQQELNRVFVDAAKRNHARALELLLEHGAQIDWQDETEQSALFAAVETGSAAAVEVLLRSGARLDVTKRDGRTVFDVAFGRNDTGIANTILNHFCLINGVQNTADINLDRALADGLFLKALGLVNDGASIALRLTRQVYQSGEEPLIGARHEYLRVLCIKIIALELDSTPILPGQLPAGDTGSDQHFLCASKWVLECLSQHSNCIKAEGPLPLLPSRVIDVGWQEGPGKLSLLSTQSTRGRYAALSHRWGCSHITKTTRINLSQRLAGIDFNELTRTMQDAVIITRRLGIRYLWIDAICIIQDSHSDWSTEASNMAEIYRNALVTIAAAAAANHYEGCFTSNPRPGPGGGLQTRGWILQEELLSRRILSYGSGKIDWECLSSNATYESGRLSTMEATTVLSKNIRFKRALCGFRSTSMTLQRQAHESWQQIVESYSQRTLTNESDKLMAIAGVAKFLEGTLQDRFLSGLWSGHLYRDLLWSTTSPRFNKRLAGISLPSWSWASVRSPVSYSKWPAGSSPTYLKKKACSHLCRSMLITRHPVFPHASVW